jgi:hypothetical protein
VLVAAMLFAAPSAQAVELVNPDGSRLGGRWQAWADRAKVPTVPGPVVLTKGECPRRVEGCYWGYPDWDAAPRKISIHPTLDDEDRRLALMHELGHDFDAHLMTGAARRRFLAIMGYSPPWRDDHGELEPPIERFANAWLACALGMSYGELIQGYGAGSYTPENPRQHRRVCSLIRRAATRARARPSG